MDDLTTIAAHLTSYAAGGVSARSLELRGACLRQAARAGLPLLTASRGEIEDYLQGHTWAPATLAAHSQALRAFYLWARKTGVRADDPMEDMPRVRVPRGVPRPVPVSRYRAARVAAQAKGPRMVLMLDLCARMGLRRAEAARVHTDDFDDGLLRIRGKGGKERMVPVPKDLQIIIDGLPVGWLFPSRKGGGTRPITPARLGACITEMLGGNNWTTHTLRHRFATNVLQATDNLRIAQDLLGHSSSATTDRYTALMDGHKRSAIEAAETLLNQDDQQPATGTGTW